MHRATISALVGPIAFAFLFSHGVFMIHMGQTCSSYAVKGTWDLATGTRRGPGGAWTPPVNGSNWIGGKAAWDGSHFQ